MVSRFARWYEEHPLRGDEPWFLALGLLVTAGALHHHRRTGGSEEAGRRLVAITATGTLALTAVACALIL